MSKINGLVELPSEYVVSKAERKVSQIKAKRETMKQKFISEYKQTYYKPPYWWQFWKGTPIELTDEELWRKLNKEEHDANFFATTSEWYVNRYAQDTEENMNKLISAASATPSIMVSVELAAILNSVR